MILRRLLSLLPVVGLGRLTPAQAAGMGDRLGSVGYVGIGPVCVLFNLPARLQLDDPEVFLSLDEINALVRQKHTQIVQIPLQD